MSATMASGRTSAFVRSQLSRTGSYVAFRFWARGAACSIWAGVAWLKLISGIPVVCFRIWEKILMVVLGLSWLVSQAVGSVGFDGSALVSVGSAASAGGVSW